MKRFVVHPIRRWRAFRRDLEEWLTPSEEEIKTFHEWCHRWEMKEWYRTGINDGSASSNRQVNRHQHAWRCVRCKEKIAREVALVCADCVHRLNSGDEYDDRRFPHHAHEHELESVR